MQGIFRADMTMSTGGGGGGGAPLHMHPQLTPVLSFMRLTPSEPSYPLKFDQGLTAEVCGNWRYGRDFVSGAAVVSGAGSPPGTVTSPSRRRPGLWVFLTRSSGQKTGCLPL